MNSTANVAVGLVVGALLGFGGREALIHLKKQRTVQASEWKSKEDQIVALGEKASAATADLEKARQELATAQAARDQLASEQDTLKAQVGDLTTRLQASDSQREEAQRRVAQWEGEKRALDTNLQEASAKLATAQKTAEEASKALADCSSARTRAVDELSSAKRDSDQRMSALQSQLAATQSELEQGRTRLAGIDRYQSALEVLGKTPASGVCYYGEAVLSHVPDRAFELCDEQGTPLEDPAAVPASGQFARTTAFVNVLEGYPGRRLLGSEWSAPPTAGALPPGALVRIDEVNDGIWGEHTWIRFSLPETP